MAGEFDPEECEAAANREINRQQIAKAKRLGRDVFWRSWDHRDMAATPDGRIFDSEGAYGMYLAQKGER
jgi:hypothetical protein